MRLTNILLHIFAVVLMIPDAFFVGIAFLWGMQYLSGMEIIVVPLFVMAFFGGFFFSMIGGIVEFTRYKKIPAKKYMKHELLIHGSAALSFGLMIAYTLMIILNPAPKIPELSTDSSDTHISVIDMAGFAVAIAGIIFTLVAGTIRNKKAVATASDQQVTQVKPSVSRPKFCRQCGKPTGASGEFCGNCGSKLV